MVLWFTDAFQMLVDIDLSKICWPCKGLLEAFIWELSGPLFYLSKEKIKKELCGLLLLIYKKLKKEANNGNHNSLKRVEEDFKSTWI